MPWTFLFNETFSQFGIPGNVLFIAWSLIYHSFPPETKSACVLKENIGAH